MTTKSEFNAEEWERIVEAPALAAARVITAERGGTLRESLSLGRLYAEVRQSGGDGLLQEVVASPPQVDPKRAQELLAEADERLRGALELVDAKATPEEAKEYRGFLMRVAETAARAHKEGGFLGIGGTEVSEREQAVLDELARTLQSG